MEVPTEEPKNEPLADDVQPMDVEEAADDQTNQEKQEALNKMEEIEDCFSELKNRLFSAKIEAVKLEIQEVKEGTYCLEKICIFCYWSLSFSSSFVRVFCSTAQNGFAVGRHT